MYLTDAFIQSDLHCIQAANVKKKSVLGLAGNQTQDLGAYSSINVRATGKLMF